MGRRNKERKSGGRVAESATTVMKMSFENHAKFQDKLSVFRTGKYNWTAHIYRGMIFYEEYAVFDLYCHCCLTNWYIEAEAELIIGDKLSLRMDHLFEMRRNCISCPTLIKWADLIDPQNGYVQDGKVMLEIRMTSVPKKVIKNAAVFVKDYPGIKNLEVLVAKSKFRVNRELLAYTSAFFDEEMDGGRLKEDEPYVLEGINPQDFRLYVDLVYHPKQYFSAYHAKDMLEIASRFRNTEIVTTCQNVILEDLKENKLSSKDKAKLAEVYDLDTVKELFKPEAMLPQSTKPRFMVQEPKKLPSLERMEKLRDLVTDSLVHHLEECPHASKRSHGAEEPEIDMSVPSTSGMIY